MTFSKGARRLGGRHANKLRDAPAREWAGPSLSHIRRRTGGFPEIPRSIRGAASAPKGIVFLGGAAMPAKPWHTVCGTGPFRRGFQAVPCPGFFCPALHPTHALSGGPRGGCRI